MRVETLDHPLQESIATVAKKNTTKRRLLIATVKNKRPLKIDKIYYSSIITETNEIEIVLRAPSEVFVARWVSSDKVSYLQRMWT